MGSDAGNEPGAGMAGGAFELLTEQCGEDLVGMYEGSVKRTQAALQELREAQQKAATALQSAGLDATQLGTTAEDFERVMEQLPDYIATAQAAVREMRALRDRVDQAQQRSKRLAHAIETDMPLVLNDMFSDAVGSLGSLLGFGGPSKRAEQPPAQVVMESLPPQ